MTVIDVLFWLLVTMLAGIMLTIETGAALRYRTVVLSSMFSVLFSAGYIMFWIDDHTKIDLGPRPDPVIGAEGKGGKRGQFKHREGGEDPTVDPSEAVAGEDGAPPPGDPAADAAAAAAAAAGNGANKDGADKPAAALSKEPFSDCPQCPSMVLVEAGHVRVAQPIDATGQPTPMGGADVAITAFAVGRMDVTRREFALFVKEASYKPASGCMIEHVRQADAGWERPGFGQGNDHPVVCVTYKDANAYVDWLSKLTGKTYRLLSESEWEYVSRAGSAAAYPTGETVTKEQANFARSVRATTSPTVYQPNAFGLYDSIGNAWQMTEDCWAPERVEIAANGAPYQQPNCTRRTIKGGAWDSDLSDVRVMTRSYIGLAAASNTVGFRIARPIERADVDRTAPAPGATGAAPAASAGASAASASGRGSGDSVNGRPLKTATSEAVGSASSAGMAGTGMPRVAPARPDAAAGSTPGSGSGRFVKATQKVFQDCANCPTMVKIPPGEVMMDALDLPPAASDVPANEGIKVAIAPMAVGQTEVTRDEFAAFVSATQYAVSQGCIVAGKKQMSANWEQPGIPQDKPHPVVCISYRDAEAYAQWLSKVSGRSYRLPSESEWEFAARAGTDTPYWTGSTVSVHQANFNMQYKGTLPVAGMPANPFGLYDVIGNAWEMTADCWAPELRAIPKDGTPYSAADCARRTIRGGGWDSQIAEVRSSARSYAAVNAAANSLGFRVVRTLDPAEVDPRMAAVPVPPPRPKPDPVPVRAPAPAAGAPAAGAPAAGAAAAKAAK